MSDDTKLTCIKLALGAIIVLPVLGVICSYDALKHAWSKGMDDVRRGH